MSSARVFGKSDAFSSTILKHLKQSLVSVYGIAKADRIYEIASAVLKRELDTMDDRGRKAVRYHLIKNILPGFAYYKALLESGINLTEAIDLVCNEINRTAARTGKHMNRFGKLPFAYSVLRLFIRPIMKYGFPKEGWTIIWKEYSRKRISFDVTSCLYYEELKKRKVVELCPAFCKIDHVYYDPLSPKILFMREGTMAQPGNKVCDFCFEMR
jgi:hypothetical protein